MPSVRAGRRAAFRAWGRETRWTSNGRRRPGRRGGSRRRDPGHGAGRGGAAVDVGVGRVAALTRHEPAVPRGQSGGGAVPPRAPSEPPGSGGRGPQDGDRPARLSPWDIGAAPLGGRADGFAGPVDGPGRDGCRDPWERTPDAARPGRLGRSTHPAPAVRPCSGPVGGDRWTPARARPAHVTQARRRRCWDTTGRGKRTGRHVTRRATSPRATGRAAGATRSRTGHRPAVPQSRPDPRSTTFPAGVHPGRPPGRAGSRQGRGGPRRPHPHGPARPAMPAGGTSVSAPALAPAPGAATEPEAAGTQRACSAGESARHSALPRCPRTRARHLTARITRPGAPPAGAAFVTTADAPHGGLPPDRAPRAAPPGRERDRGRPAHRESPAGPAPGAGRGTNGPPDGD